MQTYRVRDSILSIPADSAASRGRPGSLSGLTLISDERIERLVEIHVDIGEDGVRYRRL